MIPYGSENAISRERLCEISGLNDSAMRIELSELKMRYPICSSCQFKGYFRPRADRPKELEIAKACREELFKKARTMMAQLKTLDNFVYPDGQMELF